MYIKEYIDRYNKLVPLREDASSPEGTNPAMDKISELHDLIDRDNGDDTELDDADLVYDNEGNIIDMRYVRSIMGEAIKELLEMVDPTLVDYFNYINIEYTWQVETFGTTSNFLFINPSFLMNLFNEGDITYIAFALLHECYHVILGHTTDPLFLDCCRKGEYYRHLANVAQDLQINWMIENSTYDMEKDGELIYPFDGISKEMGFWIDETYYLLDWPEIYNILLELNGDPIEEGPIIAPEDETPEEKSKEWYEGFMSGIKDLYDRLRAENVIESLKYKQVYASLNENAIYDDNDSFATAVKKILASGLSSAEKARMIMDAANRDDDPAEHISTPPFSVPDQNNDDFDNGREGETSSSSSSSNDSSRRSPSSPMDPSKKDIGRFNYQNNSQSTKRALGNGKQGSSQPQGSSQSQGQVKGAGSPSQGGSQSQSQGGSQSQSQGGSRGGQRAKSKAQAAQQAAQKAQQAAQKAQEAADAAQQAADAAAQAESEGNMSKAKGYAQKAAQKAQQAENANQAAGGTPVPGSPGSNPQPGQGNMPGKQGQGNMSGNQGQGNMPGQGEEGDMGNQQSGEQGNQGNQNNQQSGEQGNQGNQSNQQSPAEQAQQSAEQAQQSANNAAEAAEQAQQAAEQAQQEETNSGNQNQQNNNGSKPNTSSSQRAADKAQRAADKAQEAADEAQEAADAAQDAANEAADAESNGDSKGAKQAAKEAEKQAEKAENANEKAGGEPLEQSNSNNQGTDAEQAQEAADRAQEAANRAQAAATAAQQAAQQAQQDASNEIDPNATDSGERSDTQTAADEAQEAANSAQEAANKAKAAAKAAEKAAKEVKAAEARGDNETAEEAAQKAIDSAFDAEDANQEAGGESVDQSNVDSNDSAAEQAQTAADNAKQSAENAQKAADEAQAAADEAQDIADEENGTSENSGSENSGSEKSDKVTKSQKRKMYEKAADAQEAADEAQKAADEAQKAATEAQREANKAADAQEEGDNKSAKEHANKAKDALKNANDANKKAGGEKVDDSTDVTKSQAEQAQEAADKAQEAADRAQSVADQLKDEADRLKDEADNAELDDSEETPSIDESDSITDYDEGFAFGVLIGQLVYKNGGNAKEVIDSFKRLVLPDIPDMKILETLGITFNKLFRLFEDDDARLQAIIDAIENGGTTDQIMSGIANAFVGYKSQKHQYKPDPHRHSQPRQTVSAGELTDEPEKVEAPKQKVKIKSADGKYTGRASITSGNHTLTQEEAEQILGFDKSGMGFEDNPREKERMKRIRSKIDKETPFNKFDGQFKVADAVCRRSFGRKIEIPGLSEEEVKARREKYPTDIEGRMAAAHKSIVNWKPILRSLLHGALIKEKNGISYSTMSRIGQRRLAGKSIHDVPMSWKITKSAEVGEKLVVFLDTSFSVLSSEGKVNQVLSEIIKIASERVKLKHGSAPLFKVMDIILFSDNVDVPDENGEGGNSLFNVSTSEVAKIKGMRISSGGTEYWPVYDFIYDNYTKNPEVSAILVISDSDLLCSTNPFIAWAAHNEEEAKEVEKLGPKCIFFAFDDGGATTEDYKTAFIPWASIKVLSSASLLGESVNTNLSNIEMNKEGYYVINEAGFKSLKGGKKATPAAPAAPVPPEDPGDENSKDDYTTIPSEPEESQPVSMSEKIKRIRQLEKRIAAQTGSHAFSETIHQWIKTVYSWRLRQVNTLQETLELPQTYCITADNTVVINNETFATMGTHASEIEKLRRKNKDYSSPDSAFDPLIPMDEKLPNGEIMSKMPAKAFSSKCIDADINIVSYRGNLIIQGFMGEVLPRFIPKKIIKGSFDPDGGGNLIVMNCPNLKSYKNMPTNVEGVIRISGCPGLKDPGLLNKYKEDIEATMKNAKNASTVAVKNKVRII